MTGGKTKKLHLSGWPRAGTISDLCDLGPTRDQLLFCVMRSVGRGSCACKGLSIRKAADEEISEKLQLCTNANHHLLLLPSVLPPTHLIH